MARDCIMATRKGNGMDGTRLGKTDQRTESVGTPRAARLRGGLACFHRGLFVGFHNGIGWQDADMDGGIQDLIMCIVGR